jgi:hypothetical protein
MPATLAPCIRYRCILSLIVLIANTAAPLYSRNGRTLLDAGSHALATQSVARVRVVSPVASIQGFRAPVGLSKGGFEANFALDLPAIALSLPTSAHVGSVPKPGLRAFRRNPPLRC